MCMECFIGEKSVEDSTQCGTTLSMHLVAFHSLHDLNTPAAKILYAFPTIDFRNSTIFHKLIF